MKIIRFEQKIAVTYQAWNQQNFAISPQGVLQHACQFTFPERNTAFICAQSMTNIQ
jgi:hypothetical protein